MTDVILAAFVGGLISLDRTAFLQVMVSQPLVAGTLIGFSLGDPVTGLMIGSVLELLWIGTVPVGSSIPPNETVAAIVATSVTIIGGRHIGVIPSLSMSLMIFSILLSIPLAMVGQRVDISVRNYNKRFVMNAEHLLESGDLLNIDRENLKGLASFFTASLLSLMALITVGLFAAKIVYPLMPDYLMNGFSIAFGLFISLGIAVSIRTARGNRMMPILSAGFLIGMFILYIKG